MKHTCPFSRCRMPIDTYENLVAHVRQRQQAPGDKTHNLAEMTPEEVVAEARHLRDVNLSFAQSVEYHVQVADSWRNAAQPHARVPAAAEQDVCQGDRHVTPHRGCILR